MSDLLTQILHVIKGVNTVYEAADNVNSLIELVTGTGGSAEIVSAITALQSDIDRQFATLINAVQTQSATQQWSEFAHAFSTLQAHCVLYSTDLQTLDSTTWMINSTSIGRLVAFRSWCEGTDGNSGALGVLINDISTLHTTCSLGGNINLSLFDAWEQLSDASTADVSSGFFGQTRWTMMYLLMQEIYQILSSIFLLRLSILKLYLAQYPENPYQYIDEADFVARMFGNTSNPATVWGNFATRLETYTAPAAPSGQYRLSASSNDSYAGPDASTSLSGPDAPSIGVFGGPTSVASLPNAFFSAIKLTTAEVQYTGPTPMSDGGLLGLFKHGFSSTRYGNVMYLTGTAVSVGPGLTFTPLNDKLVNTFDASSYVLDSNSDVLSGYYDSTAYLNTSYVAPQTRPNNNIVNVVTGFQIVACNGNRRGIALQYGQLDLSDPMNPRVTVVDETFHAPMVDSGGYFFAVQGWDNWNVDVEEIDTRPAGPDSATYALPMSNLTFSQVHPTGAWPTGTGDRVGLLMQSSVPIYEADFFQPDRALGPRGVQQKP